MNCDGQETVIEVEAIKHLPNEEQVELIANKFAEVANLYEPLDRSKISIPSYSESDIPVVDRLGAKEIMEEMNVNKACRNLMCLPKFSKHLLMSCLGLSLPLLIIVSGLGSGQII